MDERFNRLGRLERLKRVIPVELAQYAINRKVDNEPAFAWRVPFVIKTSARILERVKSKYWSRTHKYSICIPKTLTEAMEIDRELWNTLWMDAIKLEM